MRYLLLLGIAFSLAVTMGCNDRRSVPPLQFTGSSTDPDSGADAGSEFDLGPVAPSCVRQTDGIACDLPGASGICLEERCLLVACELGYGNCNSDPADGCETSLSTTSACGGCALSCETGESCQLGRGGYTCTRGIVCPRDRFDVDGDRGNDCEVARRDDGIVRALGFEPEVVGRADDGELVMAGYAFDDLTVYIGERAFTPDAEGPRSKAVAVGSLGAMVWAAFEHGIAVIDGESSFFWRDCRDTIVDASVVGETLVVATQSDVVLLGDNCAEDLLCEEGRVYPLDYLRAFFPQPSTPPSLDTYSFDEGELSACDECLFDAEVSLDRACLGGGCDTPDCSACDTLSGCPDFRPVGLATSKVDPGRFFIATARGIVGLRLSDLAPRFRLESPFVPGELSGAAVRAIATQYREDDVESLWILGAQADLREMHLEGQEVVEEATLVASPARLDLDMGRFRSVSATREHAVVADQDTLRLVGRVGSSLKVVDVFNERMSGVTAVQIVDTWSSDVHEIYESANGQISISLIGDPTLFQSAPESEP